LEEIEKTLSPNPSHKDSLGMVGFLKFNRDMIRYCGEVVTVSRVASRTFKNFTELKLIYEVKENNWLWAEDWLDFYENSIQSENKILLVEIGGKQIFLNEGNGELVETSFLIKRCNNDTNIH
jgi:hypothetical protein